jgi:hypothetical protein
VHSFAEIIDSSNMNPVIWSELAGLIEKNYDKVDGFVILTWVGYHVVHGIGFKFYAREFG